MVVTERSRNRFMHQRLRIDSHKGLPAIYLSVHICPPSASGPSGTGHRSKSDTVLADARGPPGPAWGQRRSGRRYWTSEPRYVHPPVAAKAQQQLSRLLETLQPCASRDHVDANIRFTVAEHRSIDETGDGSD